MRGFITKGAAAVVAAMSFFATTPPAYAIEKTYDFVIFEVSVSVCAEVSPGVEVCQVVPG